MRLVVSVVAVTALLTGIALGAQRLPSGLTAAQQADLRKLPFAVVPNPLPAGFHITLVSVDVSAQSYEVDYLRSSDGATMKFQGAAAGSAAAATPTPAAKHGFFQQVASNFGKLGNLSSQSSAQHETSTDPVAESEKSGVIADSALIGPTHFAAKGQCLQGVADSSKAQIQNATFSVNACNLTDTDPLIRAYKSVAKP
jgi:hypothetical protein